MGSKQIGIGLYEFLIESELQHYYSGIKNDLKVQSVSQLKYVTDEDMVQIGMSRPEIRRLKKYFLKHCPQTYLAKIKKKLLHRKEDSISIASLSGYSQNIPGRSVKNVTPGRHIIQAESIVIHKTLGSGEFGTVQQGVWTSDDGQRTQVAIKCLSKERMENNPVEFLKEAAIMHNVDHEHIVRLYGVVLDTSALMLVTELAPLRSLLECLKEPSMRPNLSMPTLYDFAVQICDGMQYLESKRLIHRDLAARNILVFSRSRVKISDFGLSRALGVGKDYYQTNFNVNLKLPIAWCAPECINFLRFTSASDVWAYGVTLWEMFSYGFQPWAALTGQQILEAIDEPNYNRLEKPECCPSEIYYHIMLQCWQHDPSNRPTFSHLSTMILESKPELVQAIRESEAKPRRDFLVYDAGEVITVLDKKPSQTMDDAVLWKGALKDGKTGLFNPANTITYLGSSLPSVKSSQSPFHRNEPRSSSMRKGRISADMISGPQGDLKHTGHVGPDGNFFGDLTFLGSKCWVPRQVVPPYKPDSTCALDGACGSSSVPGPQSSSRSVKESTSDMSSSDTIPLLETASSMSTDEISKSCSSTGVLRRRSQIVVSLPGGTCADQDHEYHEISDEETDVVTGTGLRFRQSAVGLSNPALSSRSQSPLESLEFDKNFDLEGGPSLIDEVFSALQHDCHGQPDEAHNVKNELREMARSKKKFASVKPISSSDRRTLDHAIAIANELASRSMLDLDRSGKNPSFDDISSPQTPNSPSHRRKFSFILGSSKGDRERRNYSQEAASIPDIQSTLTEEAKEAYNSLVEKPSSSGLGFLTPSFDTKAASFQFPEKQDDSLAFSVDTAGPHSLTDSPLTVKSSATVVANVTNFPGKFHARSLSKNDADDVVPVNTPLLTTREEDEIDGNPLRLLRQNKQAYLTNVLPLPPRKGSAQQTTHTTRHQRKHPLLIPGRQNTYASENQPTVRAPAPPPPPKPIRQAFRQVGPTTESESTERDSSSTIRVVPNCSQVKEITNEIDIDTSSCDAPDRVFLATDSNGASQSVDPISLYENVTKSADGNEENTLPGASEVNADDCCGKPPMLHGSSKTTDVLRPTNGACGASVPFRDTSRLSGRVNGQNFQNLVFHADESVTVSSTDTLRCVDSAVPHDQLEAPCEPAAQIRQPFRISPGSSIKIKTLQRILGPSATEQECCWALEAVDMDSAHAVKLLRLKALLPEALISSDATRVVSVLEMSHWDVARAAAFLINNTAGGAKPAATRGRLRADVAESLAEISALRLSSSEDGCLPTDSINNNSYQQDSAKRPTYIRPTQV